MIQFHPALAIASICLRTKTSFCSSLKTLVNLSVSLGWNELYVPGKARLFGDAMRIVTGREKSILNVRIQSTHGHSWEKKGKTETSPHSLTLPKHVSDCSCI